MTAPEIGEKSWLQGERFAAFRAALEYASHRPLAQLPLSKLTAEETYLVWDALQRGHLVHEPTADDRGRRLFAALAEELWGMPSMSGKTWSELGPEVRAMWEQAADAVAVHD